MKRNERKLLVLAGVLFAVVLVVRVAPLVAGFYGESREEVAILENRIERYRQLIEESEDWSAREAEKRAQIAGLEGWVFEGSNPNLVASSVQRELRRALEAADVRLRQMGVAESARTDGWLVVNQEMSFLIDQGNILKFLNLLEQTRPRLFVTEFSITQSRRQYTGNLTVTGFSRAAE